MCQLCLSQDAAERNMGMATKTVCESCGSQVDPKDKYCSNCGSKFSEEKRALTDKEIAAHKTAHDLVKRMRDCFLIKRGKVNLGKKSCDVTVDFHELNFADEFVKYKRLRDIKLDEGWNVSLESASRVKIVMPY